MRIIKDTHFNVRPGVIAKRLEKPVNEVIAHVNRKGAHMVRETFKEFMNKDPFLESYSSIIDKLPSEVRPMQKIRSSGVGLNIGPDNKLLVRFAILSRFGEKYMGKDGYWTLMVYTFGRRSWTSAPGQVIPLRVDNGDTAKGKLHKRKYDNKLRPRNDYNGVRFVSSPSGVTFSPIAPTYNWLQPATEFIQRNWRRRLLKGL